MKKFLMTISKKNIPKIFLLFLAFLIVVLFSSVKTVYAAESNNSSLFDGSDFRIDSFTNDGSSVYMNVTSKLPRNGIYATHLNFSSCDALVNNETVSYSLTCVNENENGFIYSSYEKYLIEDFSLSPSINFKLLSIDSYDLSNYCITFNTTGNNVKTLRWANAYSYISSYKQGWPWEGNNYLDIIYFSLFVDDHGKINPSMLNSCRFGFQDKNKNWVYLESSFKSKGTKDFHYSGSVMGQSMYIVNLKDAYYYDLSEPSRTDGLRKSFNANMYATENGIDSIYLNLLMSQYTFDDWPSNESYQMDYCIIMEHAPKLNIGAYKGNNDVDTFEVVQFSYWDDSFDLIGASLYDTDKPIYVVSDEDGNESVVTINDNGEIIPADDYSVDDYGVVHDQYGNEVHAHDRNHNIANDESWFDKFFNLFGSFASIIKTVLTIGLFVLGLVLVLKLVRLLGSNNSKGNNVNITVKSGSNKYRRKKK